MRGAQAGLVYSTVYLFFLRSPFFFLNLEIYEGAKRCWFASERSSATALQCRFFLRHLSFSFVFRAIRYDATGSWPK